MTLVDSVVMDEGDSRRVLSFCKPIIYKLSSLQGRDEGSLYNNRLGDLAVCRTLCRVSVTCEKV
jgi:hypothetical protein